MKTICAEAFFQARSSNKNICCAIFVIDKIDGWLHHNKIFSFKMKKSMASIQVYEQFGDSINNWFIKLFWFSWKATKITKYLLSKCKSSVSLIFSLLVQTKYLSMQSVHLVWERSPYGKYKIMIKQI